ncbi:MAG: hypothetical protein ACPLSJ_06020 [Thermosulfidibacteraceae bacterium]|jgi:tetratricopeptide (TPR) repeat protein
MVLSTKEYREVWNNLVKGDLGKVESSLTRIVRKDPSKSIILAFYYTEIEEFEKAKNTLSNAINEQRNIDKNLLFYYVYTLTNLGYEREKILGELNRKALDCHLDGRTIESFVNTAYSYATSTYEELEKTLSSLITHDFETYIWYLGERIADSNEKVEETIVKEIEIVSKNFIPANITLYKLYRKTNNKRKMLKTVKNYLRINPFDREMNLAFANLLLEKKPFIFKGSWLKKIINHLTVKAILEPIKLENYWIYRALQLNNVKLGLIEESVKWALVEEKLLLMLVESVGLEIASTRNRLKETLDDSIETLIEVLENKELTSKKEFNKLLTKKREIKLIKEMYDLSSELNNYEEDM